MARYLKENQIAEYRECFNLYDKKQNGRIECSDLVTVMRSLGQCPTTEDIHDHLKHISKRKKDVMDFSQFLTVMHRQMTSEKKSDEIFSAFQMTDELKNGTVPISQLRHILMNTGEKMTAKEVDVMFRKGNVGRQKNVKYREFINAVSTPLPDY